MYVCHVFYIGTCTWCTQCVHTGTRYLLHSLYPKFPGSTTTRSSTTTAERPSIHTFVLDHVVLRTKFHPSPHHRNKTARRTTPPKPHTRQPKIPISKRQRNETVPRLMLVVRMQLGTVGRFVQP